MSAFGEASTAYETAATASVYSVSSEAGPVAVLSQAHARLRRLVTNGDDDLSGVAEIVRYARYRLATNILPPDHESLGIKPLADELAGHLGQMDGGTPAHGATFAAFNALGDLLALESTSLAEDTIDLLGMAAPDDRLVVLAHRQHVAATAKYLVERGAASAVISSGELRLFLPPSVVVCVGPHQLFPAAVWTAARADTICFVQYPLGRSVAPSGGLFGTAGGLETPRFRSSGATSPVEDSADFVTPYEGLLAAGDQVVSRRHHQGADTVDAQLLLLEGGYAVWTEVTDGSWMWSVDFTEPNSPIITPASAANVTIGSYVIFRDEGATRDLVQAIADARHGASRYREVQHMWKESLRHAIARAGGYGPAANEIRLLGATTVNLRSWANERSIRPHSRMGFAATCRFAGLESDADSIWGALTAIKRAHLKAGQSIRKLLVQALISDGGQKLVAEGFQHLEVAGLGRLSAYRVVYKHPDHHLVDAEVIDEPFLAEERGWQG